MMNYRLKTRNFMFNLKFQCFFTILIISLKKKTKKKQFLKKLIYLLS